MTYETLAALQEDTTLCDATRAALEAIERKRAVLADLKDDIMTAAAIGSAEMRAAKNLWEDFENQLSDLLSDIRFELESKEELLEEPWA